MSTKKKDVDWTLVYAFIAFCVMIIFVMYNSSKTEQIRAKENTKAYIQLIEYNKLRIQNNLPPITLEDLKNAK